MVTSQQTKTAMSQSITGGTATHTQSQLNPGSKIQPSMMTAANKTVTVLNHPTQSSPVAKRHEKTKMKGDTVCHNDAFAETLRQRANASPRNVF